MFSGFHYLGIIFVTAVPFGIYDLVEAMDNVESAEAAGDPYPTTRVLAADGVVSLIGCLTWAIPSSTRSIIGHPGWKGGRIGYSAATGLMVIVLSWFGVISLLLALVPVVAISRPALHRHADRCAGVPNHAAGAAWCKTFMDGPLGVAGTSAAALGFDELANVGVLYPACKRWAVAPF